MPIICAHPLTLKIAYICYYLNHLMTKTTEEADYLAEQIRSRISALYSEHFQHSKQVEFEQLTGREAHHTGEMEAWMHDTLKRIYLLILGYLESRKLPQFAQTFKDRYEAKLDDRNFMLDAGSIPFDEGMDEHLYRLREFEDFLLPFPAFNVHREEKRISGHMLESVLSNTHLIIKETGKTITNETSVYSSVQWFLEMLYPDCRYSPVPIFPGKFKTYRPDLHIPELQTAIEYKLIRPGANPEEHIDQVKTDAINYRYHDRYNLFYAVLYFIDNKKYKKEALESCWKSKNFPPNWKLIIVNG